MKYLIVLMLLIGVNAFAECTEDPSVEAIDEATEITTDVPSHLKGATVTVRRADGKESTVPAEKFKVVPRKQQFVVTRVKETKTVTCSTNKSNRVSLLGGYGARNGLSSSTDSSSTTVESSTGVVGGAQYQRMLNDRWSLGVQGQTNETGSLLFGMDF